MIRRPRYKKNGPRPLDGFSIRDERESSCFRVLESLFSMHMSTADLNSLSQSDLGSEPYGSHNFSDGNDELVLEHVSATSCDENLSFVTLHFPKVFYTQKETSQTCQAHYDLTAWQALHGVDCPSNNSTLGIS